MVYADTINVVSVVPTAIKCYYSILLYELTHIYCFGWLLSNIVGPFLQVRPSASQMTQCIWKNRTYILYILWCNSYFILAKNWSCEIKFFGAQNKAVQNSTLSICYHPFLLAPFVGKHLGIYLTYKPVYYTLEMNQCKLCYTVNQSHFIVRLLLNCYIHMN
jgi:hypothetical protein